MATPLWINPPLQQLEVSNPTNLTMTRLTLPFKIITLHSTKGGGLGMIIFSLWIHETNLAAAGALNPSQSHLQFYLCFCGHFLSSYQVSSSPVTYCGLWFNCSISIYWFYSINTHAWHSAQESSLYCLDTALLWEASQLLGNVLVWEACQAKQGRCAVQSIIDMEEWVGSWYYIWVHHKDVDMWAHVHDNTFERIYYYL